MASTVSRDVAPSVAAADTASLVTGNTDFAFALYHGLSGGSAGATGNLFYSPYSVSLALAMTYAGAKGATGSQMAAALHFTLPEATLHPAFDALDLAIEGAAGGRASTDPDSLTLSLANSLWGDESDTFAPAFVNTLAANYAAPLRTVDFAGQPDAAESAINAWVSKETSARIDPLLAKGAITPDTRLVLVNAIYFKASWQTQFDKAATQPGTFTRADGSTVQAPLMNSGQAAVAYAKGSNYQAVELPYSSETASMVVVLPDAGAYAAVEAELSGSFFDGVTSALSTDVAVQLTLPRFQIKGETSSLKPTLQGLGMVDAFVPGTADFTGMVPAGQISIFDVVHQAFVSVDETGTEAAAATAVIAGTTGARVGSIVPVNVNRSFFFFIRDVATNSILFVGREDDPTAE